jgi:regulator of sigma E protease
VPNEPAAADAADAPEPTFAEWLRSNGVTLAILGALFVYLYVKFDSDGLWAIAKAALGLGFVIFVHELGHFLVAKWCDVHVTTFSIGFGPAIPGCVFKWGETTYKLALLPLGGYVQMVGQVDGDESTDEEAVDDPRSYRNKSVWQRMAIISAGVIMNVILAIICFIVVFKGPGKDRKAAIIDTIDGGGPAARVGLRTASVIYQVGGVVNPYFDDLMFEVMATRKGTELDFVYGLVGDKKTDVKIEPRKEPTDNRPMIGISPPKIPQLDTQRYYSKTLKMPARFQSAAASATPPLAFGDRIVAMTDPENPKKITPLPPDPRHPVNDQRDYFEFARRLRLLADSPVTLRVEREVDGKTQTVDVVVPPAYHNTLGARMRMGQITLVRQGGPGDKAGVKPREREKSHDGDVIVRVEVTEPSGLITRFSEDPVPLSGAMFLPVQLRGPGTAFAQILFNDNPLDPVRLPGQLRQWARRMAPRPGEPDKRIVTLHVRRHSEQQAGNIYEPKVLKLTWDPTYEDNKEIPMSLGSPLSIPGLGIGYRVKTTIAGIDPSATEGATPNPLRPGDVIKEVRTYSVGATPEEAAWGPWVSLEPEQWARVFIMLQAPEYKEVALKVERDGSVQEITMPLRRQKTGRWRASVACCSPTTSGGSVRTASARRLPWGCRGPRTASCRFTRTWRA